MSRKKDYLGMDVFGVLSQTNRSATPTTTAIDAELFGALGKVDMHRLSASPVNLLDIYPDPTQPRRTIPHVLRGFWNGDGRSLPEVFKQWVKAVERERGSKFDIELHLNAKEDIERNDQPGPLEENLLGLIELAVSIRIDGLTNPITVAPMGLKYRLETGERRWLAYNLLYIYTKDDAYSRISARTVDRVNVWRQAAENNARSNLNAISRARQFAMLLMDLIHEERGIEFIPMDKFEHEQEFYAQVSDGTNLRVPRGTSERLLAASGLRNKNQVSLYRRLLELPRSVWQIADDLNWTEYFIREMRERVQNDEAAFIELANRTAREKGYRPPVDDASKPSAAKASKVSSAARASSTLVPGSRQYYTKLTKVMSKTGVGKQSYNQQALDMIRELRSWLDEQERTIRRYDG
ncbi:MAG: ParB N-terminal domain-containing protein [Anaerolineae bacterium]|nr:ParB N-terminal domain-containing protein [Anaerolineae bacterium]MDW8170905.1 ParB N-terminal domain-containing protein [Anaerolineae bacterium]